MKFVNLDGMSFIGPGSEWLWSMLQLVVVTVSLAGLYLQVKLQSSTAAAAQMDGFMTEWGSERMSRYLLAVLVARRDGSDPTELPEGPAMAIANFWEKIASLAREKHLDMGLLSNASAICQLSWALLAPWVMESRRQMGVQVVHDFEWLAGSMADADRRAGGGQTYDEAYLTSQLGRRIRALEELLAVEQAMRAVVTSSEAPRASSRPRERRYPGATA